MRITSGRTLVAVSLVAAVVAACAGAASPAPSQAPSVAPSVTPPSVEPSPPAEPVAVKIGSSPWIGLTPWRVAVENGLDKLNGVAIEFVNIESVSETNAALASGQLDAASVAGNLLLPMFEQDLPLRIVMIEDVSLGADAVIGGPDIKSIKDLKGKKVASEEGTTSHLVLHWALEQNGMSVADVELVPLLGSDAGAALLAGQVDAAATWEPYVTAAVSTGKGFSVLASAGQLPGLVSDFLVVSDAFAAAKPDAVTALLKTWQAGLDHFRANPDESLDTEAQGMGASIADLKVAFDGVRHYGIPENHAFFASKFDAMVGVLNAILAEQGVIKASVDARSRVDLSFLKRALPGN